MNDPVIVVLLIALGIIFLWRPSEPSGITIVMPPVSSANPEDSDGGAIWFMIGLIVLAFLMLG